MDFMLWIDVSDASLQKLEYLKSLVLQRAQYGT